MTRRGLAWEWTVGFAVACAACGGQAQTAPAPRPNAPPTALAETEAPSAEATATDFTPLVAHVEEATAGKDLGPDFAKLATLSKLSPKTQKALLKNYLWKATGECTTIPLVDVAPAPGLFVANGKSIKVRDKVYEGLKAAAARAVQRGLAIEVVSGYTTIADAVKEWNHSIIETAHKLAKAAPPADQKEKAFASDARKAVGEEGPGSWDHTTCETGRLGGWYVYVQLVTVDASGKRGAVLVKAGDEGEHFTQDDFESIYWNKPKGKSFRTLTELMSAGRFVRQCSQPYAFFTSPMADGTWRCKQGTESWDPPNRPIPAWQ